MKKTFLFLTTLSVLYSKSLVAQYPVSFPDGVIVGSPSITIPAGSTYKLAVGGGILTEKVRVATTGTPFWADFVFEPNFKLRTLSELDKYIKLNKHLPDIPSTTEVAQNGIDLAETQALLLQKVEELTLYIINQNKKINGLEREVRKLSRKK